ncbi:YcxB family protein [Rhizobium sp. SG2393]|uniref:YcxB family protein n=1 Tax=Rhizobium sp. SG2393 TaxID=3276279 RepID=UPI00366EFFC9
MSETAERPAALPPVIRYVLTQADYNAMAEAARGPRDRWVGKWLFWPLVAANVVLSAWFLWPILQGDRPFDIGALGNLAIAALLLAWRFLLVPAIWRSALRRLNLEGRSYEITFADEAIALDAGGLSSRVSRSEISAYTETEAYFLLWINKAQAVIVPKRALNTPEGEDALRAYMAAAKWKKR